jgi:hypothetical protein
MARFESPSQAIVLVCAPRALTEAVGEAVRMAGEVAERPRVCARGWLGATGYPPILRASTSFTTAGLPWPFISRMTAPTKNPMTLVFPLR